MGDIFREIDEELRQERYAKLWQAYGKYVIGLAVVIVLAVAGYRGWQHYRITERQAESDRYARAESLLRDGNSRDSAAMFAALAEDGTAGYAMLARFRQAALRASSGDVAGAIAIYDAIAADTGLSQVMREAAVVLSVMQALGQSSVDRAALEGRLQPLLRDDGPWRHSARELLGVLALQAGDSEGARKQFTQLVDDLDAPNGIKGRAAQVLAVIGQ